MTTRGGEAKKNQKYKNKSAYEVRFNQRKLDINASAPLDRLCTRCMEQVRWKIQFGKYKPATSFSRCNKCHEKNINKAYRTVCDRCADKEKCCSKCGQAKEIAPNPKPESRVDRNGVDKGKLQKMEEYLEELRERSRRMVVRRLMKGEVEWQDGYFVTVEDGKPIPNLRFKADIDDMEDNWGEDDDEDDDDFGDDDDEDDDEDDEEERKVADKKGKGKEVKGKTEEKKAEEKVEEPKKEVKGILKNNNKQQEKQQKKKKEESDDDDDLDDDDLDDEDF